MAKMRWLAVSQSFTAVSMTAAQNHARLAGRDGITRKGSAALRLVPAWLRCRSLLAGDSALGPLAGVLHRLPAGSYTQGRKSLA
ncbi:MAG: hypothetical protein WDM96_02655 [Lacunisphaera sp.]